MAYALFRIPLYGHGVRIGTPSNQVPLELHTKMAEFGNKAQALYHLNVLREFGVAMRDDPHHYVWDTDHNKFVDGVFPNPILDA